MNSRIEELEFLSVILNDLKSYPDHNPNVIEDLIQNVHYKLEREVETVRSRYKSAS